MQKHRRGKQITAALGGFILVAALFTAIFSASAALKAGPPTISLREIAGGFSQPLGVVMTSLPDDDRLFVLEKGGKIKIIDGNGQVLPTDFIDIVSLITIGSEQGLLGMAFDPNFAKNGQFYLSYSQSGDGASVISRFTLDNPWDSTASIATEERLIRVEQDFSNHNGGDIHFGPDGYLYIALGDGGSGNDPNNRAQTRSSLLGSLLRIDVDPNGGLPADCGLIGNYSIPNDNPFVGDAGSCNEIWAYGVRNPWRMSFDRQTGDLYFGDVGQGAREELNFQPAASSGGENYGWRCREGDIPTPGISPCDLDAVPVDPIYAYPRAVGQSVTGGYVYRGSDFPRMQGIYFSGDFGSGQLFRSVNSGGWTTVLAEDLPFSISSFGETSDGELLIVDYGGKVYRVIDALGIDLTQSAPKIVKQGEPTVHTFTVTNVGSTTLSDIVITNTLPAGTTYVSGGNWDGSAVTWNVGGLDATESTTVSLTVTSTQTYTNSQLSASGDGLFTVQGDSVTVKSWVDVLINYLPIVQKE